MPRPQSCWQLRWSRPVAARPAIPLPPPPPPCPPAERSVVLTNRIDRLVPSDPFTVPQGAQAWVTTPVGSGNTGLFGSVGGGMSVSVYAADRAPNTHVDARGNTSSGDPKVVLRKPNNPVRLPVGEGRWRTQTVDLGIRQQH